MKKMLMTHRFLSDSNVRFVINDVSRLLKVHAAGNLHLHADTDGDSDHPTHLQCRGRCSETRQRVSGAGLMRWA